MNQNGPKSRWLLFVCCRLRLRWHIAVFTTRNKTSHRLLRGFETRFRCLILSANTVTLSSHSLSAKPVVVVVVNPPLPRDGGTA